MISVCMPYFDRQDKLDRSLSAYRSLYPNIEINICDDGSRKPVYGVDCRVHFLPKKDHALNPCVPINRAVAMASSDIIVLTNPEIEHIDDVLSPMLNTLNAIGPLGYVTASCLGDRNQGWLAHSSIKPLENGRGAMPANSQFHFCAMFHKSLWDLAGGFDEEYRAGSHFDDNDWLWRLDAVGAKFVHLDDLVVHHYNTATQWPKGGWQINHDLHKSKWGHKC